MIELSASAKKSLDEYLRQVRAYLRWSKTTDAGEVEQNITEHIENELGENKPPVSVDALNAVLSRLGRPWQWVPEAELPWWRRLILKFSIGPQHWGLAYLAFGLLVGGFLASRDIEGIIVCIVASSLTARASLEAAVYEKELGAQRWLVYPPLIVAYLSIIGGIIGGIISGSYAIAEGLWQMSAVRTYMDMDEGLFYVSVIVIAASFWWIIFGAVTCKWPGFVRALFRPFANGFKRRHGAALMVLGLSINVAVFLVALYLTGTILK